VLAANILSDFTELSQY
jgi:hypothetical protein